MLERFQQFSFIISGINRHIQRLERTEMIKYGYKGSYAQYLVAIQRFKDGVTCTQLSEICDKDKAAVSRTLTILQNKGYIVSEDKKYRARLVLTDSGREVAKRMDDMIEQWVGFGGSGISDEDRATFYRVLESIALNLRDKVEKSDQK